MKWTVEIRCYLCGALGAQTTGQEAELREAAAVLTERDATTAGFKRLPRRGQYLCPGCIAEVAALCPAPTTPEGG